MNAMDVTGGIIGMSWAIPVIHAVKLLVETLLAVEIAARIGIGALVFLDGRPSSRLEKLGAGFLLGLAILGTTLHGLALAGLFLPSLIWVVPAALSAAAWKSWRPSVSLVRGALTGLAPPGWAVGALMALCAGIILFLLMLPDLQQDSYIYHFGAPWQFLVSHRAIYDWTPCAFAIPLPLEMNHVYPILLGDDRLAKWIVAACFPAVGCIWLAHHGNGAKDRLDWLAPLFALSSYYILFLLPESKNDAAASAFFVGGALLLLRGRGAAGLALLGACAAAKYVYGPLAAIFALGFSRPHRKPAKLVLLAIPVLPWLAAAWLGTGDPLYPHGFRWFPNPTWNAGNNAAFMSYILPFWPPDTLHLPRLPLTWIRLVAWDNPALLLLIPLALGFGRNRAPILACFAGSAVTIAMFHNPRYLIPSLWLTCLLVVLDVRDRAGKLAAVAALVIGGYTGYRVVGTFMTNEARTLWRDALVVPDAAMERRLSTYGDAVRWMAGGRGRVLSIGELKTYRFPVRVVYGGGLGETPLVWKLSMESRDSAELRVRMKQLGITRVAFNYVNEGWIVLYSSSFQWDQRSLRLYVDFCKKYLVDRGSTATNDFNNGGFMFYELAPRPVPKPPAEIWFAPGFETVYAPLERVSRDKKRPAEILPGYLSVLWVLPDVGTAWNKVGHAYSVLKDFPNALKYLDRFGRLGMVDEVNLVDYGAAVIQQGDLDRAEKILADALQRYTDRRPLVRLNQASLYMQRAIREMVNNRFEPAGKYADSGLAILADVPETDPSVDRFSLRIVHAFLLGIKTAVETSRGRTKDAIALADSGLAVLAGVPADPALIDLGSRQTTHAYLLTRKAAAVKAGGDRNGAGEIYLETIRLYPSDPRVKEWLDGARQCGMKPVKTGVFPEHK